MKKIIILLFIGILASCVTHKKVIDVPVVLPKEHYEYTNTNSKDSILLTDSIYIHDSIYIKEKGDTIFYYKTNTEYRYKTKYEYIAQTDTFCVVDSIPYPVTITEYKEITTNKLTWLQRTLMYIGIATVSLLVLLFGVKYIKRYLKR